MPLEGTGRAPAEQCQVDEPNVCLRVRETTEGRRQRENCEGDGMAQPEAVIPGDAAKCVPRRDLEEMHEK